MGQLDDLIDTIEQIHAAAIDQTIWPSVLASVTRLIGGVGGTLELLDRRKFEHQLFFGFGVPAPEEIAYLQEFVGLSPRIPAALLQKPGEVAWDYQILDEAGLDRSPFYANFLAPMGMRYAVAGILRTEKSQFAAMAVQRSARQGHVGQEQIALMTRLIPHAGQALEVAQRLSRAEGAGQTLEQTLEWLVDGVLLLDAGGKVVHSNRAAQAMLRRRDGLIIRSGAPEFAAAAANRSFQLAMAAIGRLEQGDTRGRSNVDFVAGRDGDLAPYAISMRSIRTPAPGRAIALLFIHDPLANDTGASLLQAAFGLTAAEAHLATALRQGVSIHAYAATRGVSLNTVHTHLRRIKDKCRQSRMPELVRILNTVRTIASPADGTMP